MEPVKLDVSEKVLLDAGDAIRARLKEHGHTERSFTMIAEMWTTYIKHSFTSSNGVHLRPYDVAQMMNILKMARSVYGYSEDNFVDGAGYTALAAMLHPDREDNKP
jgi:hypothetical protein